VSNGSKLQNNETVKKYRTDVSSSIIDGISSYAAEESSTHRGNVQLVRGVVGCAAPGQLTVLLLGQHKL